MLINTTLFSQDLKTEQEVKGLQVGQKVESFSAIAFGDSTYQLSNALENGPVVLIFIRGQWCPICNKHLSKIQDSLQLIYDKGATVVVISPEKPEYLEKTIKKTKGEFTLLYDEGRKIAQQFDVAFLPDESTRKKYNTFLNADLSNAHSDDTEQLVIPATFIINQQGEIVWRQFDANYKNRSSVNDILENIPN